MNLAQWELLPYDHPADQQKPVDHSLKNSSLALNIPPYFCDSTASMYIPHLNLIKTILI